MSIHQPYLTIGLPVYNGQNYVGEAIKSILKQTYEDFELIIADNASTDDTSRICRRYALLDSRIRYIRNAKNLGAAANYNMVLSLAKGKYFKWSAHDDCIAPTFLEKCVNILERNNSVVTCYPRTVLIDENGQEIEKYDDRMHMQMDLPHQRLAHTFENLWLCNPVFGLMRTDVLRTTCCIGKYPGSDVVLLSNLSLLGGFYEIPEFLFFRRIHPAMSRRANESNEKLTNWFDTGSQVKICMPKTRFLFEYMKIVWKAKISFTEKVDCSNVVIDKWFYKYWRHIGGEFKCYARYKLQTAQNKIRACF